MQDHISKPVSIEVRNLNIQYQVSKYGYTSFKEWVLQRRKHQNSTKTIRALRDINLTVHQGEAIALIGHNGCGKSTLLKAIAGIIISPGASVKLNGRVAPLIELGAGFDRELSGVENIRLSCMLMGLSRREIEARIDSIINFSELREFIEIPLKNYSSGMYARLGFACATAVDPEILLVDEVLSVGDSNFGKKCLSRIHDLQGRGTTIVLVSHDSNAVKTFCDRAVVLSEGRLVFDGSVDEALQQHEEIMQQRQLDALSDEERREVLRVRALKAAESQGSGRQTLDKPTVESTFRIMQHSEITDTIDASQPFTLEFFHKIKNSELFQGQVSIGIGLETSGKTRVGGCNNLTKKIEFPPNMRGNASLRTSFNFGKGIPGLSPRLYRLILGVHDGNISRDINTQVIGELKFSNSLSGPNVDDDILALGGYLTDLEFTYS